LARPGLEKAATALPGHSLIRVYLRRLYERVGAWNELGEILRAEIATLDNAQEKLAALMKMGELMLSAGDPVAAITALEDAHKIDPTSDLVAMQLSDAYTASGRADDAYNLLNAAIEAHKRKRSPELALLQYRMARLAAVCNDSDAHLKWLSFALDTDSHNFAVAGELADAAFAGAKYDLAMKALRTITMVEESDPVLRAKAFYQQARIAHLRNDLRRAQHWARKAKSLNPEMAEIDPFLKEIGG
jgi:tetratricopeptide (TPR) repeat protein